MKSHVARQRRDSILSVWSGSYKTGRSALVPASVVDGSVVPKLEREKGVKAVDGSGCVMVHVVN